MASAISRRYAAAYFQVARDRDRVDAWGSDLERARAILTDARVHVALSDPRRGASQRIGLAMALLDHLAEPTRNLARLLILHGRLGILDDVVTEYRAMQEGASGVVHAMVAAAVPLDAATRAQVSRVLGERLGRRVQVETVQDPAVVGGLVIRIGERVIDSSLRSQLEQLQAALA